MEGTAVPVVTVEAPPVAWLAMVEREEMAALAVRVQQELLAVRMVPMEPQAVWAGLVATEATPSRAPQEMAALAEMEDSLVPVGLVSVRLLQAQTAGMPATADLVGLRAPVGLAVLPEQEESMATAATAEMVVSPGCRAMVATEPTATRPPPMAATVARAATPGMRVLEASAAWQALGARAEPVERMDLMAPLSQAAGMEATAAMGLTRQRPAQLEAMAEPEAPEVRMAMAERVEPAATELLEQMALQDQIPVETAGSAKLEAWEEMEAMEEPADRFRETAELEAWLVWAEQAAMVEPELPERMELCLEKPEAMEGLEVPVARAEPEDSAELADWPSVERQARPAWMVMEEPVVWEAQAESAATEQTERRARREAIH